MPQIYDMGPTEGRRAEDFFALKIRRLQPALNPQTWVLKASTLPLHIICISSNIDRHPAPNTYIPIHYTSLHFTTLVDTSLLLIQTSPNYSSLHFTILSFGLTPFKIPTTPFHLTSLQFTSLHFTVLLANFRHTSIPFASPCL